MNIPELAEANWEEYNNVSILLNPYRLPKKKKKKTDVVANQRMSISRNYSFPSDAITDSELKQHQAWHSQSLVYHRQTNLSKDELTDSKKKQVSTTTRRSDHVTASEAEQEVTAR